MITIADRLRTARSLAGNPPSSLVSTTAGLSHAVTSLIETGKVKTPSAQTVVALARVLGVSTEWLVSGTGPEPRESSVRRAWERATREAA